MSKDIYLETGALRSLGKSLEKLKELDRCYTSILSILELVSRATSSDADFKTIKPTLKRIKDLAIHLDCKRPEEKISDSYSQKMFDFKDSAMSDVLKCYEAVISTSTLNEYMEWEKTSGLKYKHDWIQYFDNDYTKVFIEGQIQGNLEVRKAFEKYQEDPQDGLFSDEELKLPFHEFILLFNSLDRTLKTGETLFDLNYSISVHSFTTWFLSQVGIEDEELHSKIYNSYNNNADVFMKAMAYYWAEKTSQMGQPSRNDLLDLYHFLYVTESNTIVSGDKFVIRFGETFLKDGIHWSKLSLNE